MILFVNTHSRRTRRSIRSLLTTVGLRVHLADLSALRTSGRSSFRETAFWEIDPALSPRVYVTLLPETELQISDLINAHEKRDFKTSQHVLSRTGPVPLRCVSTSLRPVVMEFSEHLHLR